jgi:hypothetical protein
VEGISAVQSPTGSGKMLSVREFSQAFVFFLLTLACTNKLINSWESATLPKANGRRCSRN